MNKLKQYYLLFVFLVAVSAQAVETVNLSDAYNIAQKHNEDYAISGEDLTVQLENKNQTRANLLPQIRFSRSLVKDIDSNTNPTNSFFSLDRKTRNSSISLSQSIFSYANITNYLRSDNVLEAQKLRHKDSQQTLILTVSQFYFDILNSKLALDSANQRLQYIKVHQALIEQQYKNHQATNIDLFEVNAEYQDVEFDVLNRHNQWQNTKLVLTNYIGINTDYTINAIKSTLSLDELTSIVTNELFTDVASNSDWQSWLNLAKNNHYNTKIQQKLLNAAKQGIKNAKSEFLPTVDFLATYRLNEDQLTNSASADRSYQLQLNIPIFQGLRSQSRLAQTKAEHRRANLLLDKAQKDMHQQLRSAYNDTLSYKAQILSSLAALKANQLKSQQTEASFKKHNRTNLELLEAHEQYQSSHQNYFQTIYNYLFSYLALKRVAGVLSEKDLLTVDNLFTNTS